MAIAAIEDDVIRAATSNNDVVTFAADKSFGGTGANQPITAITALAPQGGSQFGDSSDCAIVKNDAINGIS